MQTFTQTISTRCSTMLLVLTISAVLLLKALKMKSSHLVSRVTDCDDIYGFPKSASELALGESLKEINKLDEEKILGEIRIMGYWKEVRASLDLPPLSDAVVVVQQVLELGAESHLRLSDEEEKLLRRIGRLNPFLHRRRSEVSASPPDAVSRVKEVVNEIQVGGESLGLRKAVSGSALLVDAGGMGDYGFSDSSSTDTNAVHQNSNTTLETFPELFIAPGVHAIRRAPVGALAASFRAIAAREMKARHSGIHPRYVQDMHR